MSENTRPTIVTTLKACPAHNSSVSREHLLEAWGELRLENVILKPTPAVMAAVVLQDYRFSQLLNAEERAQLRSLVELALDRYEQTINPPNKLGRLLAEIIKKESI